MPPLKVWLLTFGLASAASIVVTFLVLRLIASKHLTRAVRTTVEDQPLRPEGKLTLFGIGFLAIVLLIASALNQDLGAPACAAGLLAVAAVSFRDRATWRDIATSVAWSVLPLVAGLFVIVEALNGVGALHDLAHALNYLKHWPPRMAALGSGFGIAIVSNLMNNLPSGLIAAAGVQASGVTGLLRDAVLVGVDLGPNLSVTGSLATILWLIAIRREGLNVTFWDFLKWGALVMPPALLLALLALGRSNGG
jgi:arsenical pump membrane protein